MHSQLKLLRVAAAALRARIAGLCRESDAACTTETVIALALLVAMVIAGPAPTGASLSPSPQDQCPPGSGSTTRRRPA